MGYSSGAVKFEDGTIKYFCYNHISDVCIPKLYDTIEEMDEYWGIWPEEEECEHNLEDVEIYTCFGNGLCWEGKACKKCNMILENLRPYELEDESGDPYIASNGEPDWILEAFS